MGEEEAIVNLRIEPIFWFTCHLQEIFIIQKKYPVKAVAKEVGVSQDSLYRYIRGELQFPFRLLIPYLKATIKLDPEKRGDITILNFIANEIDHSIIPRLDGRDEIMVYGMAASLRDLRSK